MVDLAASNEPDGIEGIVDARLVKLPSTGPDGPRPTRWGRRTADLLQDAAACQDLASEFVSTPTSAPVPPVSSPTWRRTTALRRKSRFPSVGRVNRRPVPTRRRDRNPEEIGIVRH